MTPKKLCNHAGCQSLVDYSIKYCSKHEEVNKPKPTESDTYEHRKRIGGKYHAFYKTKRWEKLSQLQRINNPVCEMCLKEGIIKEADVADHIIEIRDDWEKRYDETNLQSLCHAHHNHKSIAEKEKRK